MPLFTTDELVKVEQARVPSLVGNHLLNKQGSLLIVAETESGKSVVTFDIAFSLVKAIPLFRAYRKRSGERGDPFFPVHTACKVLYVDTELGPVGCQERLRKFYSIHCDGVELGDRFKIVCGDYVTLMLQNIVGHQERPLDNLDQLLQAEKPDVLVLDPFAQFHNVDENTSAVNLVLKNLKALQMRHGCACILVHHESDKELLVDGKKIMKSDSTARVRGHSSISAWADTMLRIHREDKEAPYTFLRISWPKVRHGPKPKPSYLFLDFTRMYVQWVCSHVASGKGSIKDAFLEQYKLRNPLPAFDEEELPDIPTFDIPIGGKP